MVDSRGKSVNVTNIQNNQCKHLTYTRRGDSLHGREPCGVSVDYKG